MLVLVLQTLIKKRQNAIFQTPKGMLQTPHTMQLPSILLTAIVEISLDERLEGYDIGIAAEYGRYSRTVTL